MDVVQAAHNLGKRVVLSVPLGRYPRGYTGMLVSIQAGREPGANGPYATVNFDLQDWSDEENVPLDALRSFVIEHPPGRSRYPRF
jgi:hypothetical protein